MNESPPRSLTILLVEDHGDTRRLLRTALERRGHNVFTACSVAEATTLLQELPAEILISDIGLPDGTGWDLLSHIRPGGPTFAIAISGFGSREDRSKSKAAGYDAHLVKPFKSSELDRLLNEGAQHLAVAN